MAARRFLAALLIALLVSGAFTYLLARRLMKPHTSLAALHYVTTSKDLDVGEVLQPQDVKMLSWPADAPVSGAVLSTSEVVGRAILNPLVAGQPIVGKQLSGVGGVGLSAKIPEGMRAVSLKSDQVVGVAGFLLPGTHTDVLVTYRSPSSAEAVTSTVLQNVSVIAAGQKTQPDPDGKASTVDVVTLLVTPTEAERVVLANTQGTLHFVLRNGADQTKGAPQATSIAALGLVPPNPDIALRPNKPSMPYRRQRTPAQPVETKLSSVPYSIVVTRGDKQTTETF